MDGGRQRADVQRPHPPAVMGWRNAANTTQRGGRFLGLFSAGPVATVGHSMGGGLAAITAGTHPDAVGAAVLIDPVGESRRKCWGGRGEVEGARGRCRAPALASLLAQLCKGPACREASDWHPPPTLEYFTSARRLHTPVPPGGAPVPCAVCAARAGGWLGLHGGPTQLGAHPLSPPLLASSPLSPRPACICIHHASARALPTGALQMMRAEVVCLDRRGCVPPQDHVPTPADITAFCKAGYCTPDW